MVSVIVFEFSGLRCQPLRRALCLRGLYLSVFIQSIILFALQ
ncbi:acetyltransferase [Vibrio cholerae]|nr:acetyltransferase [Vibrio cholerae]